MKLSHKEIQAVRTSKPMSIINELNGVQVIKSSPELIDWTKYHKVKKSFLCRIGLHKWGEFH